jgi:hypothetical protein
MHFSVQDGSAAHRKEEAMHKDCKSGGHCRSEDRESARAPRSGQE